MQKVWFITGAAKGIGNAVTNAVLKAGEYVVATTRKENDFVIPQEYSENVLALALDVSDPNEEIYNPQSMQQLKNLAGLMCLSIVRALGQFCRSCVSSTADIFLILLPGQDIVRNPFRTIHQNLL